MKKLILLVSVASLGFISCDKEDVPQKDVPSAVVNALEAKFPEATDVEWEKHGANYEADFDLNMIDYSALISSESEILKFKYYISTAELPEAVSNAISSNYPDKIIDDADVLQVGEMVYYQIEFDGGLTDTHKIFSASGEENPEIEYWD